MGVKADRLRRFLSRNPICCYCGGEEPATTQDHFPPRSMFHLRQWPQGYVFPACARCNNATSLDESIIGMLGRLNPGPTSKEAEEEVYKQMQAMAELFPEVFKSMFPTANQVKRWLRRNGTTLQYGVTTKDVPLMSINHPRISEAAERFATKLFCSLYYLHTRRVLPNSGGIVFSWHSNERDLDEVLPRDILAPMLTGFPEVASQQTSLKEQFFYRYAVTTDAPWAGAFLAFFHQSLAMLGFAFPEIARVKVPDGAKVLHPFKW